MRNHPWVGAGFFVLFIIVGTGILSLATPRALYAEKISAMAAGGGHGLVVLGI